MEQQEEQDNEKRALISESGTLKDQLKEAQKKADEDVIQQYEEQKKRSQKELENTLQQLADAEAAQKRAESSKKKAVQEVQFDK